MTDATPPTPPASPTPAGSTPAPAATPTTPAAGAATVPAGQLHGERTPLDLLREHQSTMVVVLAVVIALLAVVLVQQSKTSAADAKAWEELGTLRDKQPEGTDGFSELAARHKGTSADPFIRIAWAARLYEAGQKDQVQQAKDLLEQVVREHGSNPFVRETVPAQIEKLAAELADPKAKWPAPAAPAAPVTPPAAPSGGGS